MIGGFFRVKLCCCFVVFFLAVCFCKVGKEASETKKSTNIIKVGACVFFDFLKVWLFFTLSPIIMEVENGCI